MKRQIMYNHVVALVIRTITFFLLLIIVIMLKNTLSNLPKTEGPNYGALLLIICCIFLYAILVISGVLMISKTIVVVYRYSKNLPLKVPMTKRQMFIFILFIIQIIYIIICSFIYS